MPRYVQQVLDSTQDVDNTVRDLLVGRRFFPFTIIWPWQAKELRRKTYQAVDHAVALYLAEELIRRNKELFGDGLRSVD